MQSPTAASPIATHGSLPLVDSHADSSSTSSTTEIESELRDGQTVITALTIPALFGELEKSRVNSDLHHLLVATHSYFLPTEQLLSEICERVLNGCPAGATAAERTLYITRMGSLLKLWGRWRLSDMQSDAALKEQFDRATNRLLAEGDDQIKTLIRNQVQYIEKEGQTLLAENERVALSPFAQVPTSWERSHEDVQVDTALLLDTSPDELSRNLTFLESLYFNRINVSELMNKRFEKSERSPNLYATIERFNAVTSWVSTLIVMAPSVSRRVDAIARFIDLAKAFEQMKNFSGVIQIVSALQNVSISRLKQTWALVQPRSLRLFEELCPYANPEGNYAFYRKQTASATPPFLPYLGCFTKDLTAIEEMTSCLPNGKVNWEKMTHLGRILRLVQNTKDTPFKIQPNIALCKRLLSLPLMSEKAVFRVSRTLEPGNSQGAAGAEKITKKTISREKRLQAKEERQKAKEEERSKRAQRSQGRTLKQGGVDPAVAVCSRCAQLRASFETCRLTHKTLETERNEVASRHAFLDRRLDEIADFLSQAQAGVAGAPPSELIKESKAELLKHFIEIAQLETAVTANGKRLTEFQQTKTQDSEATELLAKQIRSYIVSVQKIQASFHILRASATQQSPELDGLFEFVRESYTALINLLMRQILEACPSIRPVEQPLLPASPLARRGSRLV